MANLTTEKTNGLPVNYRNQFPPFNSDAFGEDFLAPFNAFRRAMLTPFSMSWTLPELPTFGMPAVNLYEKDGGYIAEFAVPGYAKADLAIEVSGNVLTVSGKFEHEKKDGPKYHCHELRTASFSRALRLPLDIDQDQVTATVENGILKIALQPVQAIQHKTIPIKG